MMTTAAMAAPIHLPMGESLVIMVHHSLSGLVFSQVSVSLTMS